MIQQSDGRAHKWVTRVLASGVMLGMYAFGMIATTGATLTATTTSAQARGRGWGRGRGGGWGGPAIGLGIGAAIVGGAIAAQEAERAAAADNAVAYCMRRFRSYNPDTGTYIGKDGRERLCP